jgi:hypothetical protein
MQPTIINGTTYTTLESRLMFMNSPYNTNLSEQFLIDCDARNNGCNGGWPNTALSE